MVEALRSRHLEETGGNLRFLQAVLEESQIGRGSRVFEIGCGTGLMASYLAACTGAAVTGTERCSELARIASRRIRCLHVPDGRLPDLPEAQDLVVCKDVLPMIEDKGEFLTGVRRLLRPAGPFLTYVPVDGDFEEKPLYRFIPDALRQSQERYGALSDLVRSLCQAGFASVSTRRLFLGTVALDRRYVAKHLDGFFSNTEAEIFAAERGEGLERLRRGIELCEDAGLLLHYEWERTMVIAR